MINRHGVLITVLFALIVSLISVSAVFWEFYKLNKNQYIDHIFTKHAIITQIYTQHQQKKTSSVMLEANLAVYKLNIVDANKLNTIANKGKFLKQKSSQSVDNQLMMNSSGFYTQKIIRDFRTSMFSYKNKIYFFVQTPNGSILIEDEELKPYRYFNLLYTYTTVLLIIFISFFLILQKLRPLIRLRRKIAIYGDGDMNISFKMRGSDEIASVANELEATKDKINNIMDSRTLFLRNIMHELKTPIAKGTIATQMLKTDKQRDRFTSIFGRLESLVNEFALIEEVTSLGDKTEFKEYRVIDVIDGAIDMAMVERDSVDVDIDSSVKIEVNYRLYTTAIKNMIDNGIKYSPDAKVKIKMIGDELSFESKGDCLKYPLKYYIEPFTKENPSKNSFGLGLYLVDSILKAHNRVLAHEYEHGMNRFIFA
ncbi:MAG: ArsS family sensor histidine kinase [Thiovulaceae bacterium]|nr:ArsS family sensor histidine kinase [Sulfurimonadaceae bacterium]MCW9025921.1 ArsS family sensor histidine kinase [Sulfurimonadaceae bacterium]